MLLTISTTHDPATDLGHLLHKHPLRVQEEVLWFGKVRIFYPEASKQRCTAAVVLDVDPIGLVRGRRRSAGDGTLGQYVNDRPYAASSFLSVAISRVLGTALAGRSKERPELVERALPFEAKLAVVRCRGGDELVRRLFEPLGYRVETVRHPLDEAFPDWGEGPYFTVRLAGEVRLKDLLSHLYVLVPVLDDSKHYFVGEDEVEKLLGKGTGWLETHPAQELIARRYLRHQHSLAQEALRRLVEDEGPDPDREHEAGQEEESAIEERLNLNEQRLAAVLSALKTAQARSVLDLGCGEGKLLRMLLMDRAFERILGVDVSSRALAIAKKRLHWERMPPRQRERIQLQLGALTYRDERLAGFDAAAVVEVIEHLDRHRLAAFERVVFEFARPRCIVLTTPNVEYNVRFEWLEPGKLRHRDHQFEWTRAEFHDWSEGTARRFDYRVERLPVGPDDPETGPPTQMAIFTRS
ncbi:MAG: 3' terminal RNA ribose 2'-O-methyltransferase Hen1 [Deltaproteobacteria bacterium]|nr:3' terminal RNA ribose 2'-O-methyltransferase Hen1 [Deltaproteobacteria bacterium]